MGHTNLKLTNTNTNQTQHMSRSLYETTASLKDYYLNLKVPQIKPQKFFCRDDLDQYFNRGRKRERLAPMTIATPLLQKLEKTHQEKKRFNRRVWFTKYKLHETRRFIDYVVKDSQRVILKLVKNNNKLPKINFKRHERALSDLSEFEIIR